MNRLGDDFRAAFASELLHMSPTTATSAILPAKVSAIRHFQCAGYRVITMIDNEPAVLDAIHDAISEETLGEGLKQEILLLHADTIVLSRRELLPPGTAGGSSYDLVHLIPESSLPRHIEFVWHGVNSKENLEKPGAIMRVPVHFIGPLVLGAPDNAAALLTMLRARGVNRVSLNWRTENRRELLDLVDQVGLEANICNVPDLEAFLQAVLLSPKSITAGFNFPECNYFGQGSGCGAKDDTAAPAVCSAVS